MLEIALVYYNALPSDANTYNIIPGGSVSLIYYSYYYYYYYYYYYLIAYFGGVNITYTYRINGINIL